MLKKFINIPIYLGFFVAMIVTGCALGPPPPEELPVPTATPTEEPLPPGADDTLRLLYQQAPTILNPHLTNSTKDLEAARIVYEPLASFDKEGNLVPFLAAEIPSLENGDLAEDGLSVTWKLKEGVLWSDGEPFTADDVRFTYEYIINPMINSTSANAYDKIEDIEQIDDYTIKINFKSVTPDWAQPFVGLQGLILPQHIFEDYGDNARETSAKTLPVGTGPYKVVEPGIKPQEVLFLGTELVETNKIIFQKNENYHIEGKPYFGQIELRGGGTVREAARLVLQTGEIDYSWNLQADSEMLTELEALGNARLIQNFNAFVERIYFNHSDPRQRDEETGELSSQKHPHPILSDKRVREAITYAIDKERIAELYGPAGTPSSNILVSPDQYESPNTSYEFNPEKAAQLLDEAGWKDSDGDSFLEKDGEKLRLSFQTSSNPIRRETQKIVKENLEAIGIEVELDLVDGNNFFGDSSHPKYYRRFTADLLEYNDGNINPDPGNYMSWWTCDQIPTQSNDWSGENVQRWCNETYDALYEQSTTETDPEKRQALFIQMNDMIIQEAVLIPLVDRALVSGASNTISGIDLTPWDADTWNIRDWRRVSP